MRIGELTNAVPGAGAEGNVAERMSTVVLHEAFRFELAWLREVLRVHMHVLYANDDRAPTRQHHIRCNEKQDGDANCMCVCDRRDISWVLLQMLYSSRNRNSDVKLTVAPFSSCDPQNCWR
jgi:hypothetical protein